MKQGETDTRFDACSAHSPECILGMCLLCDGNVYSEKCGRGLAPHRTALGDRLLDSQLTKCKICGNSFCGHCNAKNILYRDLCDFCVDTI